MSCAAAWLARTDSQGRFEWDSAPGEPLLYWFEAEGFDWSRGLLLKADGIEHEIRLASNGSAAAVPTVTITGTAVDAETGQPVDEFKVLIGEIRGSGPPGLQFSPDFVFGAD